MTQAEKAKAYEEALGKARDFHGKFSEAVNGLLEVIFPSLADSKSEKLRKQLIAFLQDVWALGKNANFDKWDKSDCAAWIDYLGNIKEKNELEEYPPQVIANAISFLAERNDGMPKDEAKDIVNALLTVLNPKYWLYEKDDTKCEPLVPESKGWYVCTKDFYAGGNRRHKVGDIVQALGGMHIMGLSDISPWFRKAYYNEVPVFPTRLSDKDKEMLTNILNDATQGVHPYGEEYEWLKRILEM